ncbi:histone chaperone RTT106-like, partial [Cynara cardunculus var. scolymus]|uniref:histone chaperone RTT106-like n=1 Tax=Cynara cardunculus var. scolymus TaxID=59895 RepID=UPI000D62C186
MLSSLSQRGEKISSNAAVGPSAEPTINEAEAEVVRHILTSGEAVTTEEVDVIPRDDAIPQEVDEEEDEGDEPDLPDSSSDLDGNDDDDDEDDFSIQFQYPTTATKGVALRDFASQGQQKEEESAPEKNQGPSSKGKGVTEEGNPK